MRIVLPLAVAILVASLTSTPSHAAPAEIDCRAALRISPPLSPAPKTPLAPEDLVGLIDLGSIPDLADDSFFTLSPDRRKVAISVRRAIPATNGFCTGVYVVALGDGAATLVDAGPGTIFWRFANILGKADFPTGFPKVITPRWTPDGRSLLYLKAVDGVSRVWITAADGSNGRPITDGAADVLDFRLRPDGQSIVIRTEDDRNARAQREQEASGGLHYDDRFSPTASSRPFLPGPQPTRLSAVAIQTGVTSQAAEGDSRLFDDAGDRHKLGSGWVPVTETALPGQRGVAATNGSNHVVRCNDPLCSQVVGRAWMSDDGKQLRFIRREGWALNLMAIYGWDVGAGRPRRLFSTSDLLLNCGGFADGAICAREGSTQPRHVVRIDFATGVSTTLFDPNPDFARHPLGTVRRLTWRNNLGVESFGDLVYPVGYEPGHRYPLIVVQYTSRGFLRGGTGDEYPVQIFANHGFLVLNIQHPQSPVPYDPRLSEDDKARLNLVGFRERRSILSSFETIVARLIADGIADPARVGITGLSDGASTVQYAALHSRLFKVASIGSCCWESSETWALGPAIQSYYRSIGWPTLTGDNASFWKNISLAHNAARVSMPLLIQASDDEYELALESFTGLREHHRPVDLYVFPDEHHVKRQPAHRLAIYERNLDWFSFWLKGETPEYAPDHDQEALRWRALRQEEVTARRDAVAADSRVRRHRPIAAPKRNGGAG
jgi:hypothetical protein